MSTIQNFSNYTTFIRGMNDINRAKRNYYEIQNQISSGKVAQTYKGLSSLGLVEGTIDYQSRISIYESYIQNNNIILSRLLASDETIENLENILNEYQNTLTLKKSSNSKYVDLKSNAETKLTIARDSLNVKHLGKYIHSGSRTNIPSVKDIINNSNIIKGQITANYYGGDAIIPTSQISENVVVESGILASNIAIQQTIATFHFGIEAELDNSKETLNKAFETANIAMESLIQLRTYLRDNINKIRQIKETMEASQRYYSDRLSESIATPIEEAAIKLNQELLILQGSFQSYNKLSQLSLTNYM